MSDAFDPNTPLVDQGTADRYIQWCSDRFWELQTNEETELDFANGRQAAATLWVVSAAQLNVAASHANETLMRSLAQLSRVARRYERLDQSSSVREIWMARTLCDFFVGQGKWADHMLNVVRLSIAATILIEGYPLDARGGLYAPDVWTLVLSARDTFTEIYADTEDGPRWVREDFAVVPESEVVDAAQWQRARRISATLGGPPPSPN